MIIRKDKNGDEIIINTSKKMDKIYNQDGTKKKSREDKKKTKITMILPCEITSHGRIENKN